MLIYSNSSKSENNFKLFNLNDLLIQPKDYEEGFRTENKTQETIGKKGFWEIWWISLIQSKENITVLRLMNSF